MSRSQENLIGITQNAAITFMFFFFCDLRKLCKVFDLGFQGVVGDGVELLPQSNPHSHAKQKLRHSEDRQIP